MIRIVFAFAGACALAACTAADEPEQPQAKAMVEQPAVEQAAAAQPPGEKVSGAHGLSLTLPPDVTRAMLGERDVEKLAVQVMLDRTRHSPGVIDGYGGGNTDRAIRAFRREAGLADGTAIDAELLRALLESSGGDIFRTYTITEQDVRGPFAEVPADFSAKAKLDRLGYESPLEMLAERFHMDQDFLAALNPKADFSRAGTTLAIVSHGDERLPGAVAKIEVRKASSSLVALDADGTVLATYPATIGSADFPSPSGTMQVVAVAPEPNYTFDNSQHEWGPQDSFVIPPGPNNPVGGTWIDLSKAGYGIHGSPDPQLVGKTASHGCVRLTNWDAEELAGAVSEGVEVVFV